MRIKEKDIVECLKQCLNTGMLPGTSNSDVNVFALPVPVPYGVVERVIEEILYLRAQIEHMDAALYDRE